MLSSFFCYLDNAAGSKACMWDISSEHKWRRYLFPVYKFLDKADALHSNFLSFSELHKTLLFWSRQTETAQFLKHKNMFQKKRILTPDLQGKKCIRTILEKKKSMFIK